MSNIIKSFSYKENKRELFDKIDDLGRKERMKFSEIVIESLEDYVKKHGKSNNPQTQIEQFDKETILAIPNVYRDSKAWIKFYSLIKSKKDYEELDKALNMINNIHNRKLKEF